MLDLAGHPDVKAWELRADGAWELHDGPVDFQRELIRTRHEFAVGDVPAP